MTNNTQEKIKTLSELSQIIEHHKKTGGSAALCHGVFDLIHPGHIRHLAEAKNYSDMGRYCVIQDLAGAVCALFEPK